MLEARQHQSQGWPLIARRVKDIREPGSPVIDRVPLFCRALVLQRDSLAQPLMRNTSFRYPFRATGGCAMIHRPRCLDRAVLRHCVEVARAQS